MSDRISSTSSVSGLESPELLTVFEISWVGKQRGFGGYHGELDLLELLAFDSCALGQSILGLLEYFALRGVSGSKEVSRGNLPA